MNDLKEEIPNISIQLMILDLGDLSSIREFANKFLSKNIPLHILINNAGVMATPRGRTKNGFETQLGINHLGHFLLTNLLLDKLKESAPARIVVVTSNAYKMGKIDFNDINWTKWYNSFEAYGRSKLANILFTNELNRRLQGTRVTVNSVHPGNVDTELTKNNKMLKIVNIFTKSFKKNVKYGAATSVYVAMAPELEGVSGKYFVDCKQVPLTSSALDMDVAFKLWEKSEEMVALKFADQNESAAPEPVQLIQPTSNSNSLDEEL